MIMIVLRVNTETHGQKMVEYPSADLQNPLVGLKDPYVYYHLGNAQIPTYDEKTHYCVEAITLSSEKHPEFKALNTAKKTYEIKRLPDSSIIDNLNSSVGQWIDSRFPDWKKAKYVDLKNDLLFAGYMPESNSELALYVNVLKWANDCRLLRDRYENELVNNGQLPLFVWPEIPTI